MPRCCPSSAALSPIGLAGFPQHLLRLRQYGRVVNNTAMHEVLGFHPSHTTMATVADYARRRRLREIDAQARGRRDEADLEAILGGKSTSTSSRPATDDGLGLEAIVQRSR